MNLRHSLATLLMFGLAAQTAWAHQASAPKASAQPQGSVDVSKLPVDVNRIQRQLARTREREYREGLNVRYIVDVFGQSPRLVLFAREDNLLNGPVPYGAPTHKEMIYMVTPEEFRSPVMDFGSLLRWLADKSKNKK